MALSWRDQQKTFFAGNNIEFEQDQRIIDWLDTSKKTWVRGETYFNNRLQITNNINEAEQALLFIKKNYTNIKIVEHTCKSLINIPRICIAINKFVIYTDTLTQVNENYDTALLEFIQSMFVNRKIDYYYIPDVDGNYFNFASPTTQFFIT